MTNGALNVAVIGGGSTYTPELVEGLIAAGEALPVGELALMDVERGSAKLEVVSAFARRMIEAARATIRVRTTLDVAEAVAGADFVITQMRVGQLEARARDERIPLAHGCIGQETTGAGGFANALRTIPVVLDACSAVERYAPNAWIINFTNPAGLVTEAVIRHARVRSIGLCNLPITTKMQIASAFGAAPDDVELEVVGLNHFHWTTAVTIGGEERLPDVLAWAAGRGGPAVRNIPDAPWDRALLDALGALPCSYLRYYYHRDEMLAHEREELERGGTRADEVMRVERELLELYRRPELVTKPAALERRGGAYYSTAAVELMRSIHGNRGDPQIVNVRNGRTLPFLPEQAAIETACTIGSDGPHPRAPRRAIDPSIRGLVELIKAFEELTIQAAVEGSYAAALKALTIHPLVGTASAARAILDDILREHREQLPRFA